MRRLTERQVWWKLSDPRRGWEDTQEDFDVWQEIEAEVLEAICHTMYSLAEQGWYCEKVGRDDICVSGLPEVFFDLRKIRVKICEACVRPKRDGKGIDDYHTRVFDVEMQTDDLFFYVFEEMVSGRHRPDEDL